MSAAFAQGKRKRLPIGQVLFASADDFRVSIVISKKVEPTAVGRNKLRRSLYAALGTLKTEGARGHVVFIAAPSLRATKLADAALMLKDAVRSFPV
jgi:ribonuclease P protein component